MGLTSLTRYGAQGQEETLYCECVRLTLYVNSVTDRQPVSCDPPAGSPSPCKQQQAQVKDQ